MSKAETYNEALTILEDGLRHEIDKARFAAAVMFDNTALDELMPKAPKGAVANGLRGILEGVAEAYDFAILGISARLEEARKIEAEAK